MKTFDYAAAWREIVKPAFLTLPKEVHALIEQVAIEADDLSQNTNLLMPWPESDLMSRFEMLESETLALAAKIVHNAGHWFPNKGKLDLPGRGTGSHWKFSNYADQILRKRLGISSQSKWALGFEEHGGVLRLCYSSKDMWTWVEIAPATETGMKSAAVLRAAVEQKLNTVPEKHTYKRDNLASSVFEDLKQTIKFDPPWDRLMDLSGYMVEEGDERPDPDIDYAAEEEKARAKLRVRMIDEATKKQAYVQNELDGMLWFIDRKIPIDNLIFYPHTGVWTFGWRIPVGPVLLSRILEVISEFHQPYCVKTSDGRKLEGNIG